MKSNNFRKIWAIPTLLAMITLAGLLTALLGPGFWKVISWVLLAIPLAIIIIKSRKKSL